MRRPEIAIVVREIHPFGGGIGTYAATLGRFLSSQANVTIFISTLHHDEMQEPPARPQSLLAERVKVVYVDEPRAVDGYFGILHRYSANVLRALRREYGRTGPDLIEFQDYLGEGAVTIQARKTGDPFLADTKIVIRLNTTGELCAILDGYVDPSESAAQIFAMERYSLQFADRLLYGGGDIYGLYERFYGAPLLAPGQMLRQPLGPDGPIPAAPGSPAPVGGPLRMLYLGRLERRKGVADLMRAMATLTEEVKLTFVGGDTDTAPLGTSERWLLDQEVYRQSRDEYGETMVSPVTFVDHVERSALSALIDQHHLVVIPSLWECWPAVGLEAMARNRPLLGTPVGGLVEMIQPGRSGWLARRPHDAQELAVAIEAIARDRAGLTRLVSAGAPRAVHEALCDPAEVREWYDSTAGQRLRRPRRSSQAPRPLVSVIVPYYRMSAFIEDAINSLLAQTYSPIEIIVVNDGSFELDDRVLGRLAAGQRARVVTQPNSGLGAARNFGIRVSRGRFVAFLDADNAFEPSFIDRASDVLDSDPEVAYVGCWSRYINESGEPLRGSGIGYQPLSNASELLSQANVAGDAAALVRRSIYDRGFWYSEELTSYEDWDFYERLRRAGLYGHCIPERLMRYRVRDLSMLREVGLQESTRLSGELLAHRESSEVRWMSPNV